MIKVTDDYGHGGSDPGAVGFVVEKDGNLRYGKALTAALSRNNFSVQETRKGDEFVTLSNRVRTSNSFGSDWFISNHENAGGGRGITVYCYKFGGKGEVLAKEVLKELVAATGMPSLGVKEGNFQVIRETTCPAILIEFGFVDNAEDAKIISRADMPDIYGDAVTKGLCTVCNISFVPRSDMQPTPPQPEVSFPLPKEVGPSVIYQGHVENIGWQNLVANGDVVGTTGRSLRFEALRIELENVPSGAHIKYQVHVENNGWIETAADGALAGTQGKSLRIEAVKIWLEGLADYSVEYQVHVQNQGWQEWVSDGVQAGTVGQSLRLEALRMKLVKKS